MSHVPLVGHLSHMGHWGVPSNSRQNTQECSHSWVFRVIPGAGIPMSCIPLVGCRSYMGPWDVGPPGPDGTPGMGSFHGVLCHSRCWHPRVLCTIGQPLVSDGTLGCVPSYLRQNNLECNVFRVIPGADIAMSHVPSVGHLSHMGHWAVGPATRDETPWNVPIPGCSVSFQGPTFPWPVYHQLAIGLTRDTGVWAQPLEMDHPGMGSFQGIPCHSRGRHPHVPCTISRPLVLHRTLGCGVTASRRNTLVWDNSRVFYAIPGACIPVSHIGLVGHHHRTLEHGPTALRWNTLKLSHSRVFHAPQGAHIAVSCVPIVGCQCPYWLLVPVISNSVGSWYWLSVLVLEVGISRPCRCQMHNHRMEHTWI